MPPDSGNQQQAALRTARECFELSQSEVNRLVIQELQRRHPKALPISIDYEPRTEKGFCHCWWTQTAATELPSRKTPSEE
jgi:hypothetical protein